jgi:Big-like domain-containing protein
MWGGRGTGRHGRTRGGPGAKGLIVATWLSLAGTLLPVGSMALVSAAGDVGYQDISFGSNVSAPTGQKPESKLWVNDGSWWGVLYSLAAKKFTIQKFVWATDTWVDTGVVVDSRAKSDADALWDGSHLFISSHIKEGSSSSDMSARLLRYSYSASTGTYGLDTGFPVTLTTGSIETLVIDQDTLGRIWATWTAPNGSGGRQTMVTHSTASPTTFITPFVIPATGAANLTSDDISTLVAYNGKIGVLWSNQNTSTVYFASHDDGAADGAWALNPALSGPSYADDHLNIKSLQADASGQVFAAVKTSLNDVNPSTSQQPLILLLILDGQGSWQRRTFSTVADNETRPIILLDPGHRDLYIFTAAPCCSGGVIYYKKTSIDNPNFDTGRGSVFIQSATSTHLNNPTSTKQPLDAATGLLVLVGDDHSHYYHHNKIDLGGGTDTTPPDTVIDSGPSGTVSVTTASFGFHATEAGSTFSCQLDGGAAGACTSPKAYSGLADGSHTFQVTATDPAGNPDPTAATRSWTVDTSVTDTTPPSVTLTAPAAGASINGPVTVSATASDNAAVARVDFAVDGAAIGSDTVSPYSTTWDPGAAADGAHTITATAVDSSGLTAADSHAVTLDRTAPDTVIDSGPSGTVTATNASFAFHSTESGSTFRCSLDGASATSCSSPKSYTGLLNGPHTFAVTATDAANNPDPSAATQSWTIASGSTTLFSDGFESGSFSGGGWTVTTGGDGTAAVQSTLVKTGTFAARLSETANTGSVAYVRKALSANYLDLTVGLDVQIGTEGVSGANVPIVRLLDGAGTRLVSVYRQNLSGDRLWVAHSGSHFSTTGLLPLNTWGRVETHVIVNGTTSTVEIRLNGTLVYTATNASLGTAGIRTIQLGNDTSKQIFSLVADDVAVSG